MVRTKEKTIDYYVEKVEKRLLRKYPHLEFRVERWNDSGATVYYSPYAEEDEYPIIKQASSVIAEALEDDQFQIYIIPS